MNFVFGHWSSCRSHVSIQFECCSVALEIIQNLANILRLLHGISFSIHELETQVTLSRNFLLNLGILNDQMKEIDAYILNFDDLV